MTKVKPGTWVEIERVLLPAGKRAASVPDDTARTPFVLRLSGFLASEASVGDTVTIKTLAGRNQSGVLMVVNPGYSHSFGETIPEILNIGLEDRI